MTQRRMRLVASPKTGPTANYPGAWRHPESPLDDILQPERYEHLARVLEEARFDACFFADTFGLSDTYKDGCATHLGRGGQISYLDPLVVLPLMARVTRHLGLGADLTKVRTEAEAVAAAGHSGIEGSRDRVLQAARQQGISFAEAARKPRGLLVGTARGVADRMETWFTAGACDGFILWPTISPRMFEEFGRFVVPELQRRGLFRRDYAGRTLRENLRAG